MSAFDYFSIARSLEAEAEAAKKDPVAGEAGSVDVIDLEDWSQTGQGFHVDFGPEDRIPLREGRFLGPGINGGVYETTIRGANLALKKVSVRDGLRKSQMAEVEILKQLSHIHIIQIVGTYTKQKIFGCLTYPVALCTLLDFFESVETSWSKPTIDDTSYARLDTLGYFSDIDLQNKATPAYSRIGCILSAVAYLHESKIKHKDLKPSNILLTRDGTRLCGFGSALDYTLREDDLDDAGRGTPRYFAPETAEWLPSGRPADIFSLGCIFLEILTIHQKGSLKSLRENRSLIPPAFYASLDRVDTWLTGFSEPLLVESEVRAMLSRDPQNRPTAKDLVVKFALADAQRPNGALSMFKDCCRVSHIQPPQLKHHPSEATAKLEASLSVQSSTGQHYVKGVIDVEQPQVKPRQLHSCTSCWTRKFKCDRKKPCSTCCSWGIPTECRFMNEGEHYAPIQQSYELRKTRHENLQLKEQLRMSKFLTKDKDKDKDENEYKSFGDIDIDSRPPKSIFGTSIFDRSDNNRNTYSSTLGTSHEPTKRKSEIFSEVDEHDTGTAYSMDSNVDGSGLEIIQVFASRLAKKIETDTRFADSLEIPPLELDDILKAFARRLHEESTNAFGWEASVAIHRNRGHIIKTLTGHKTDCVDEFDIESIREESGLEGFPTRRPFFKADVDLQEWIANLETHPQSGEPEVQNKPVEEVQLPQLASYENLVARSDAYAWLLSKICGRSLLSCSDPNAMEEIGSRMLSTLLSQKPLRKLSRRKSTSVMQMTFNLYWELGKYIDHLGLTPSPDIWNKILCLTGSWQEAQALTVAEYIHQTWPTAGDRLLEFLVKLMCCPVGQHCSSESAEELEPQFAASVMPHGLVSISVTGRPHFISDVAERIAWLAVTLRLSSQKDKIIGLRPRVSSLHMNRPNDGSLNEIPRGSCRFYFDIEDGTEAHSNVNGSCWARLFSNPILICGYPISHRSIPNTGLEMSLKAMASLVRSTQVIRYEDQLILKGFNSLLVATVIESSVILWHALTSSKVEDRISYFDPRIDQLKFNRKDVPSLRGLENARHIIGWCSEATDFCGHPKADLNISTSGMRQTPASIYIDRLYIEAGFYAIGGANMRINQKEQPTQLGRGTDYPSLLAWVAAQFVNFYDVEDRQAWLVDGASALLHLVRISLHLDETAPESTYDWEFDKTKLVDTWPGCTGRHTAKKTLKHWGNLALPVYVKSQSGPLDAVVKEYSTFQERVYKVLHSLEILIDLQIYTASAEGIKISQSLDRHKDICGFDILDFLAPLGPIGTRTKRFESWGDGWMDLLPKIGVVTMFGKGFGELVRPSGTQIVCPEWQSVPKGEDYLISTVSTLKLLQERLERQNPVLGTGEMTEKISWRSPRHSLDACKCLQNIGTSKQRCCDPVQFMVSKSSMLTWTSKDLTRVDINLLDARGAVVFANLSLLGQRIYAKKTGDNKTKAEDAVTSASNNGSESLDVSTASMSASATKQSASSTDATEVSSSTPSAERALGGLSRLRKGKEKIKGVLRFGSR